MEMMLWGFAGFAGLVFCIIGVALWIVFRRDKDAPNKGVRMHRGNRAMPRSDPRRGVPKSR